jgi:formylmethanofuran dehydrogenase subunit E-like metal-binding protein
MTKVRKNLYIKSGNRIKVAVGHTKNFEIKTGVRHGCVPSPHLFITYMDYIYKIDNTDKAEIINEVLFADDQVLIYRNIEDVHSHLDNILFKYKQSTTIS